MRYKVFDMAAHDGEWFADFEEAGEASVREDLNRGVLEGQRKVAAEEWLRKRAQARHESSQAELIEIARSAREAAWEASRAARDASNAALDAARDARAQLLNAIALKRRATIALVAVIAITIATAIGTIVSIIGHNPH